MIDLTFVRPIIEQFYEGLATVQEFRTLKDKKTKLTRPAELVTVYEDIPCRLSNRSEPVSTDRTLPEATHEIKLFLSPEYEIKPGSHIIVTQHDHTTEYAFTGVAARYCTHQELNLELWDEAL